MFNNQRGLRTTAQNCKVKTTIEVDSDKYNDDDAYSKSIDSTLNKLFSKDINPTL
tara:strand:+ start:3017 stop:3181 length:165 start_codon:yes stop_codon:yes gene_type:complete